MKKIAIFYHVYQYGNWKNIFAEQFNRLEKSGLLDAADYIHIGITGPIPFSIKTDKNINFVRNRETTSEVPTLKALHKFCSENEDYNVLFFHATGVTWTNPNNQDDIQYYTSKSLPFSVRQINENKTRWRNYLEHFTIDNWKECITMLSMYDCVGTEWTNRVILDNKFLYLPHYAGNFWWASSDYIRKLDLDFIEKDPKLVRWMCEFWIGSGNPKYYNFYYSGKNLYINPIEESQYKNVDLLSLLM
jgi:hypothetical protein